MFHNVRESFQKESPPLHKIKDFLSSCRSDLRFKTDNCHSLAGVLRVVQDECSLTDVKLLRCVVEMSELTEAEKYIAAYEKELKKFCKSVSVSLCLKKKFNSAHHLKCEEATRERELKSILTGESSSDISNLSLLGGRDIKVRIHTHTHQLV